VWELVWDVLYVCSLVVGVLFPKLHTDRKGLVAKPSGRGVVAVLCVPHRNAAV